MISDFQNPCIPDNLSGARVFCLLEYFFLYLCNTLKNNTMQVLVEIPDDKAVFGLEVLRNLAFVKKAKPMTPENSSLWKDLQEASNEVKLHKLGKTKLKTAQELLDEL